MINWRDANAGNAWTEDRSQKVIMDLYFGAGLGFVFTKSPLKCTGMIDHLVVELVNKIRVVLHLPKGAKRLLREIQIPVKKTGVGGLWV